MYIILFFGMTFLAVDEFVGIHESLGHNMQFLASLPFIKRPDDAIIMFYLIPVGVFLLLFKDELLSCRGTLKAIIGVVIFVIISVAADVLSLPFEEYSELAASICLVIAFLLLGAKHLGEARPEA